MSEGFPMFTAPTEAPFPPASCTRLDLDAIQGRPSKGAILPVRLVHAHLWVRLWDRDKGQLSPCQADRRRGQTWEKLCGRALLRSRPEGLGHVALRAPKRRMHQDGRRDLHGHSRRAAGVKTRHIQDFFEIEKQPFDLPPPGIDTQRLGYRQHARLQDIRPELSDVSPLAPPPPPQSLRGYGPLPLDLTAEVAGRAARDIGRRKVAHPAPALAPVASTEASEAVGAQSCKALPDAVQAIPPQQCSLGDVLQGGDRPRQFTSGGVCLTRQMARD